MPPITAAALVFSSSAAVLVLEILAGRLLAPYVGVTLETFTGIIGTILAGISVGSWAGGRAADRLNPRGMLATLLLGGGILAFLAGPIVHLLGPGFSGGDPTQIVLLAAAGFFAPAAVLSAVNPTVVKIQLDNLEQTGSVVGRLSAISTAGAIFGTFATGFVLVSALPTRPILLAVGGLLVAASIATWAAFRVPRDKGMPTALGVAVLALGIGATASGPCDIETAYYCVQVQEDPARASGRLLILDNLWHSYVDLDDPTHLEFTYAQTISDVIASIEPADEPIDALFIGGGGFTLPRYIPAVRPGSHALVLELDPEVLRLGREQLGLVTDDTLEVRVGDARITIQAAPESTFDIVIGDAFGGPSVPWHLTTVEFLELIKERLTPGGTYALNVIDNPPLGFARAEARTLAEVFDHVVLLAPARRARGEVGGNFILVASDGAIDVAAILERNEARGDDEVAVVGDDFAAFIEGATLLTDDFAPVDQLITPYR